ncbi:MAG TPA: hypothetical protein VK970_14870 [Candidatus Methylacidiphilales bacterium]|nr:hypothetical protein [Candidatus Methylacidiphilales bacterium]
MSTPVAELPASTTGTAAVVQAPATAVVRPSLPPHAPIRLGPFTLHLAFEEGRFGGLGQVLFENTLLRSGELPWLIYTESESGARFSRYTLRDVVRNQEDSVSIIFQGEGEWLPRIQEADAMGDARIKTRRLHPPRILFTWTFRHITERIAENTYSGLAMQVEISSRGEPIHWVLEDTTWEIGGEAAGATLIQQDVSTIDLEQTVYAESAFSTIEKFFTKGWGGAFPMDMLPRAAGSSVLDFQTKGDLALCLFAERPSLTRARLEKFADESVIHYQDRPFFPLTENARPPERKLLVYRHPTPLKRHEWRNLWLDLFVEVRARITRPFGFEPEIPKPMVSSHLWDADLHKLGAGWINELRDALPTYARLGYKEVFTHGVWDSITSDPNPVEPGNICCPYQFKFAESFGGNAGMRQLTDAARANGLEIFQWFSFHLSRHAPVWKEHKDWVMREANGDPWDGNYGSLWSGRYRSDYGDWARNTTIETCEKAGLDGIFWDSYQNLGVTCVDWGAPDKAPQAEEIWAFQGELQRRGIRQRPEITTIFGVSNVATYGFEGDSFRRRLWSDTLKNDDIFALLDTAPGFFTKTYQYTRDKISPEVYFWMAAHRVVPGVGARPWVSITAADDDHAGPAVPGAALAEEYAAVNHLYNAALPQMHRLRLVEGATHTLWLNAGNQPSVVWAFEPAQIAFTGTATELGSKRSVQTEDLLSVKPGEVWILK